MYIYNDIKKEIHFFCKINIYVIIYIYILYNIFHYIYK